MKKLGLALSLLIIFSTVATAQPSEGQETSAPGLLPGDLFYPVESLAENLEVKIAGVIGGPEFKAKAIANNAEESLTEASVLAQRNNSKMASEMTESYLKQMNNSRKLAENSRNSNLSSKLDEISRKNIDRLEKVKEKVPEQARKGIDNAIEKGNRPETTDPSNRQNPEVSSNSDSRNVNISENRKTPGDVSEGLQRALKDSLDSKNDSFSKRSSKNKGGMEDILNLSTDRGNDLGDERTENVPGSGEKIPGSDPSDGRPDESPDENRSNDSGKTADKVPVV